MPKYDPLIHQILKSSISKELFKSGDAILISASGGADSTFLCHFFSQIAAEFNLKIFALHFNHNTRLGENEQEQEFVKILCQDLKISCKFIKLDKKFSAENFQNQARNWRIEELKAYAAEIKSNSIATAHHKNDLAETVFWKITRGTSLFGLNPIKAKDTHFIRPLLDINKKQIIEYLEKNSLKWCEDSSNSQNIYTRNAIRNEILPYLDNNLHIDIAEKLWQLASKSAELEEFFSNFLKSINIESNILEIAKINSLDKFLAKELIHRWLNFNNITPNEAQIDEIFLQVRNYAGEAKIINFASDKVCQFKNGLLTIYSQ